MPKGIDGRLLRRRESPLLACLLIALATVALATGCGGSDESGSGSASSTGSTTRSHTQTERPSTYPGGILKVVPVRPVKQDRFAYARARFIEMCAGCHTLADAGATGRRYNLDFGTGITETHVRYAIGYGEPGMPAWRDVLSPREYEELVTYIVAVSRRNGGNDYWTEQIRLREEGGAWTRADTLRVENFARKIVRERMRAE